MIKNILLIISIVIIVLSYIKLLIIKLSNRNNLQDKYTGFDIAKEITSNYDEINIVESNEISISKYNLKRKVIKLTPKDYNSNSYYSLALSSILSGYSLINSNKDNNLKTISYIFKNIDYISKSIIISLIASILTNTIGDAKISIIILIIIAIYQLLLININDSSNNNIKEQLEKKLTKEEYNKITNITRYLYKLHTIFFITNLILIIRLVIIILNM